MTSVIVKLSKDRKVKEQAKYSLSPKEALITFIMQSFDCNFNTWEYPDVIDGMWESTNEKDKWYWKHDEDIYGAYERK